MLVAGLLSFGASAQVDLNPNKWLPPETANTVMLASENTIGAMGTDVSGTAYDVDGEAGFIIPSGETYYARIDLGGGAEFGSTVADNFDIIRCYRGSCIRWHEHRFCYSVFTCNDHCCC